MCTVPVASAKGLSNDLLRRYGYEYAVTGASICRSFLPFIEIVCCLSSKQREYGEPLSNYTRVYCILYRVYCSAVSSVVSCLSLSVI